MKVNVIKKRNIESYIEKHSTAIDGFATWLSIIKGADWKTLNDLRETIPSGDVIGGNRVIFNIGGNKYRMICKYLFGKKTVSLYIKWIGTHAEYTKICDKKEQYTIDDYR